MLLTGATNCRSRASHHSKPLAPVRHPPAHKHDRNRRCQRPPDRQDNIRDQPKHHKYNPEDFLLHVFIVTIAYKLPRKQFPWGVIPNLPAEAGRRGTLRSVWIATEANRVRCSITGMPPHREVPTDVGSRSGRPSLARLHRTASDDIT